MSPVVVLALPIAELPEASPKLLTYLSESSQSLRWLAVEILGNRGDGHAQEELFYDRVLGDEGVRYTETVTSLHQDYLDYLNAVEQVLFQYLGAHLTNCRFKSVSQSNAVLVVECHYDPLDPPESSVSDIRRS